MRLFKVSTKTEKYYFPGLVSAHCTRGLDKVVKENVLNFTTLIIYAQANWNMWGPICRG